MIHARPARLVLGALAIVFLALMLNDNIKKPPPQRVPIDNGKLTQLITDGGGHIITGQVPRKNIFSDLIIFEFNECPKPAYALISAVYIDSFSMLEALPVSGIRLYKRRLAFFQRELDSSLSPWLFIRYLKILFQYQFGLRNVYPSLQGVFLLVPADCTIEPAFDWSRLWNDVDLPNTRGPTH